MSFEDKMIASFRIGHTEPKSVSGSIPIDDDDRKEARKGLGTENEPANKRAEDEWFEQQGVQYLDSKGMTAKCTVSGDRLKAVFAGNDGSLTHHHTGDEEA